MKIGSRAECSGKKYRVPRKLLSVMAIALFLAAGCFIAVFHTDDVSADFVVDGINYKIDGTKAIVTGPVNKDIETVTVPETVTNPETYEEINVYSIDKNAFENCSKLKTVVIGNNVEGIESNAFYNCSALENVTFSEKLRYIDYAAFYGCTSLRSVTFPDTCELVQRSAFERCTSLTSVNIPSAIENVGAHAFSNCTSLTSINVAEDNERFTSVDGVMYRKDMTELLICPAGITSFVIPKEVTKVDTAFSGYKLKTVEFVGDCKTEIGGGGFYNCPSITIVIRNGADVTFGDSSIIFTDLEKHTITVRSADNYVVPEVAYDSEQVTIVYKGLTDDNDPIGLIIGGIVIAVVVVGAIAYTLIKRRS